MRLLHAGVPDAGDLAARAAGASDHDPAARGALVQPLPLHRLRQHRDLRGRGRSEPGQMGGIGRSVRRLEDAPLLRGEGRFAADLRFADALHMRVVRSPIASGAIREIDIADALASPGVAAIWTGRDVAEIPPIDFRMTRVPGLGPYRQPILARDMVRYVGEPIAVVFADDPYRAEDAAELVFADFDETAPVLRATDPPGEFAPGLPTEPAVIRKEYGDLASAFAGAAHVV